MRTAPLDRFAGKVALSPTGCLLWLGAVNNKGYASFRDGDRVTTAHHWIYEQTFGPVPEGYTVDHTCRVRHCVYVPHLEAVTHSENVLRGEGPALLSLRRRPDPTKCGRGLHEWVKENIYVFPNGSKACHPCRLADKRADYLRRKDQA